MVLFKPKKENTTSNYILFCHSNHNIKNIEMEDVSLHKYFIFALLSLISFASWFWVVFNFEISTCFVLSKMLLTLIIVLSTQVLKKLKNDELSNFIKDVLGYGILLTCYFGMLHFGIIIQSSYLIPFLLIPFLIFSAKQSWGILCVQIFFVICSLVQNEDFSSILSQRSVQGELFIIFLVIILSHILNRMYIRRENELMAAQEELQKSMRIRDQFIAKVSHEIRTPLNGILGFSTALLPKVDESIKNEIEIITQCAKDILHITNDILHFCKIPKIDL